MTLKPVLIWAVNGGQGIEVKKISMWLGTVLGGITEKSCQARVSP